MTNKWKNLVINMVMVIVLATALCGCITIETPTPSSEPSNGSLPETEDQAEEHLSFQIDERTYTSSFCSYLYTLPIYLDEGDKIQLSWSSTFPIMVGYVSPNGRYFAFDYSIEDSICKYRPKIEIDSSSIEAEDGVINIQVGQTYEGTGGDYGVPAGVYEPGYYRFRFLSEVYPCEMFGVTYDFASVEVRYRIE